MLNTTFKSVNLMLTTVVDVYVLNAKVRTGGSPTNTMGTRSKYDLGAIEINRNKSSTNRQAEEKIIMF